MVTIYGMGPKINLGRVGFFQRKMGPVCHRQEPGIPGGGGAERGRFNKKSISDLGNIRGQRILVRVDYNVSDANTGDIKSDTRLLASIPTIKELKDAGAKIILISHNDDPHKVAKKQNIEPNEAMEKLTLKPVAKRLAQILREQKVFGENESVTFVNEVVGGEVKEAVSQMQPGDIVLLENTRSDPRDVKGSITLAQEIIKDIEPFAVVLDGFSVMHRDHASVTGIAKVIKKYGGLVVAGRLVEKEIEVFGQQILENPQRPFVFFSGGAKVSGKEGKIHILKNLLGKVDKVVIGGAMLYAFLKAKRYIEVKRDVKAKRYKNIGEDPLDGGTSQEDIDAAKDLLEKYENKIILPKEVVIYRGDYTREANVEEEKIPKGFKIGDVSPAAIARIFRNPGEIRTAVLNGDFGYTNHPNKELAGRFHHGTYNILYHLEGVIRAGGVAAAGGGDTGKVVKAYCKESDLAEPLFMVSTGGGAMTRLLAEGTLPGFEVIDDN